jgi:hypothetical protein
MDFWCSHLNHWQYKKHSSSNIGVHLSYCKLVFMQNDGITIILYIWVARAKGTVILCPDH